MRKWDGDARLYISNATILGHEDLVYHDLTNAFTPSPLFPVQEVK